MDQLLGMGFGQEEARRALEAAGGDAERAVEFILNPEPQVQSAPGYATEHQRQQSPDHLDTPYLAPLQRGPLEPGVITSTQTPELGSLLTILHCNFWVQQRLSTVDDLEWTSDWGSEYTRTQPQSVVQELAKQCAFVHMQSGRAQAHSALLEKSLGNREFTSLTELLECLEPLKSLCTIQESQLVLKIDDVYGDLCGHVDKMLVGQDISVPPILMLEIEQAENLKISEHWFPQRCTNALSELSSKVKIKLNDYDEQLSKVRRKRLQLRAFKGSDVLEMLRASSEIMKEFENPKTGATLDKLGAKLGSSRNHLMDTQQTLGEERQKLAQMYTQMDPQVFAALDMPPVPVHRYDATGVLVNSHEYYTRYDGQWFYVSDGMPSGCSFNTVKDACQDQSELLVVYSRIPDKDELVPSTAIREFCLNELDSMSLSSSSRSPTPDTSMSPSNRASTSESEESEMMDAVDRGLTEG